MTTTINSGTTVSNQTVVDDELEAVYGTTINNTVNGAGAYEVVYSGGITSGTTLLTGSSILSGGVAEAEVVSGGIQIVYQGGQAFATTVVGGEQDVQSGGTATDTTLGQGTKEIVGASGTTTGTVLNGASEQVASGGIAYDTMVNSGGNISFEDDGASGTLITVNSGGSVEVVSGAQVSGIVYGGGVAELMGHRADGPDLLGRSRARYRPGVGQRPHPHRLPVRAVGPGRG